MTAWVLVAHLVGVVAVQTWRGQYYASDRQQIIVANNVLDTAATYLWPLTVVVLIGAWLIGQARVAYTAATKWGRKRRTPPVRAFSESDA